MNVLFLSLCYYESINDKDLYTDLLREFGKNNHNICLVTIAEKRRKVSTNIRIDDNCKILTVRTGNIQKTGMIEKGISTVTLEHKLLSAIKKYLKFDKIDLVLYSTPPITFDKTIRFFKKKYHCTNILLLKDIFPQNAIDLGLLSKKGILGFAYRYFRKKEISLYKNSDFIGCMSQYNVDYVIKNNDYLQNDKVFVSPNAVSINDCRISMTQKKEIRRKYGLPEDKIIFVYGGNLGKPQGISFMLDCINCERDNKSAFFLIVGDGTEYTKVKDFIEKNKLLNSRLYSRLSKEDFDKLVAACDVGMIFLDYRFTIPNFPSRIISYMQAGLPILSCTDHNTDVGLIISDNDFGWKLYSDNINEFHNTILKINMEDIKKKGINSYNYLVDNYSVEKQYLDLMKKIGR